MTGKHLEDFKAGETYRHWPGRTIREYDNTWFTLLTMNTNPLHFDEYYAGQTDHGKCLVVGTLVFGIVVGMSVKDMSESCIANLEYESVRHLGPTFAGDTLYAESEVLEVTPSRSKPDRGILYIETRAFNQRKEPIMTLRRRILMPRRPGSA
ncbi:MAG: MaoC family dehydratase [Myxococcota bacterium]